MPPLPLLECACRLWKNGFSEKEQQPIPQLALLGGLFLGIFC
jgi:hypothetical protein